MINIAVNTAENFLKETGGTIAAVPPRGKRKEFTMGTALARLGVLCGLLVITGCATERGAAVKDTSGTFTTVVIDPGHGGKDSGTWSKSRKGPQVLEKNAALDVGKRLNDKLRADGFKTVMTRRSDVFVELNDRARISNAQTNAIFVSIHFNDSPKRAIHGVETYYFSNASIGMARKIANSLNTVPGLDVRSVKHANFRVLKRNEYPAVLVECGFLSNSAESKRISTAAYRQQIADKIADAIYQQRYGTTVRKQPEPVQSSTVTIPD